MKTNILTLIISLLCTSCATKSSINNLSNEIRKWNSNQEQRISKQELEIRDINTEIRLKSIEIDRLKSQGKSTSSKTTMLEKELSLLFIKKDELEKKINENTEEITNNTNKIDKLEKEKTNEKEKVENALSKNNKTEQEANTKVLESHNNRNKKLKELRENQ